MGAEKRYVYIDDYGNSGVFTGTQDDAKDYVDELNRKRAFQLFEEDRDDPVGIGREVALSNPLDDLEEEL